MLELLNTVKKKSLGTDWNLVDGNIPFLQLQFDVSHTYHNGKIYYNGGVISGTSTRSDDLVAFDTTSRQWELVSNTPSFYRNHGLAGYGDNLYLFGGNVASTSSGSGSVLSGKFYRYDLITKTWHLLNTFATKNNVTMHAFNGSLYIVSSLSGTGGQFYRINLSNPSSLITLTTFNTVSYIYGTSLLIEGKLYQIGGRDQFWTQHNPSLIIYDINLNTTSNVSLPFVFGQCAAFYNSKTREINILTGNEDGGNTYSYKHFAINIDTKMHRQLEDTYRSFRVGNAQYTETSAFCIPGIESSITGSTEMWEYVF